MPTMVKDTTTLGTALEDMDNELESMLDMISESLDLLEKGEKDEAMDVLAKLENAMLDFLDYEEADEEETEENPKNKKSEITVKAAPSKKPQTTKASGAGAKKTTNKKK